VSIKQRWALHHRAGIFDPEEGAIGASEGEAGEAGAAGEASGAVTGGNDSGEGDGNSGGAGSDGRWGAGGAASGDDTSISDGDDTSAAAVDQPRTYQPRPAGPAVYDDDQSWLHQVPIPQLQGLFQEARDEFADRAVPDKAIYFSSGGTFLPGGVTYAAKAGEIAQLNELSPSGLQIFTEFYQSSADGVEGFENTAYATQVLPSLDAAGQEQYWDIVSAAMASVSSGDVYVVLPPGGLASPGVWGVAEFPQLQINEDVKQIFWVDPSWPTVQTKTLVWARKDGYTNPDTDRWPLNTAITDTTVFPLRSP
jgi:hypothetical protein